VAHVTHFGHLLPIYRAIKLRPIGRSEAVAIKCRGVCVVNEVGRPIMKITDRRAGGDDDEDTGVARRNLLPESSLFKT
jgi:hypothetical protein